MYSFSLLSKSFSRETRIVFDVLDLDANDYMSVEGRQAGRRQETCEEEGREYL